MTVPGTSDLDHQLSQPSRRRRSVVGVIATTATFAGAIVAHAASPIDTALARTERALGGWDSPQAVIEDAYRTRLVPTAPPTMARLDDPAPLDQGGAPVFRFAIAPGLLANGLREFQALTGLAVNAPSDLVRNLTTDGVSGTFTAEEGLRRLLTGSSLSHRFTDASTVVIEIRVGESIEVGGVVPQLATPKYAGTLTETPQTIQVIPRALIEEQGATTLSEALRNVPGITMQAGEGGGASSTTGDMFTMRGFDAQNSLFVDGVRDDGLISRDVFNLEQVEVFSGPTGSDVGRTNAAGYVNMTTKSPGLAALRSAAVSFGSGESVRATVDLNQPLGLGEAGSWFGNSAVRVNVLWQDGGSPGRRHVERETRSIAPSVAFGLNTPTRVIVSGQVQRQDNVPDYGLPAAASPIGPLTATGVVADTPVDQSNFYGNPDADYDKSKQDNVTLRIEHDFGGMTLRNQTRYNTAEREAVVTAVTGAWPSTSAQAPPGIPTVQASRQGSFRQNDIFSNQTSLAGRVRTGRLQHDFSLGFEVSSENYHAPGHAGFGDPRFVDLHNPDVFSPVTNMNVVATGALTDGASDTVAFYVFDGLDLGSRLRVNGGIRTERYTTKSHGVSVAGVVTDLKGDGTLFSGKAGVIYRLSETGNIYVSYGSSLTPPGSTNFQLNAGATNQNNPNVDPQKSTNYEVGSKWDIVPGRFAVNGAVFFTENTNVIFVVDGTAIPPIFNQDDGQKVRGVSLSTIGRPLGFWDVNLNLQYLDSEVVSQNPNTNGHELARTPRFAGSLWTTFRLPYDVRVGGGVRHTDKVFISTANTTFVPSYAIVDALVEVPVGTRLVLRLNANNLTGKVYVRGINNNGQRYVPGVPRSFLLGTTLRF